MYIQRVVPQSNAARSGLRDHDVLLTYAGKKLAGRADLTLVPQPPDQPDPPARVDAGIHVTVWRDGQTLELTVRPGPLGVVLDPQPAAVALRLQREADAVLRTSRGPKYQRLEGTRREVEAIAQLFPQSAEVLLGSDASEQRLDELATSGRLSQYRFLHFATQSAINDRIPRLSALILAQDALPDPQERLRSGKKPYDGRLSAEQIRETWQLDADLVTLSACQSGLGQLAGGEGYVGFSQALFLAGARSQVLSLWQVDDESTSLLMTRFYQNLLGKREGLQQPMPKAQALDEAKRWLRSLSPEEIERQTQALPGLERVGKTTAQARPPAKPAKSYAHPYYWSAFILIGDPN